jgi:hypothetical protein
MQNANINLFNEHGLWQTLDVLTANKTQPGISFFVGLTLPLVACKDFTSQAGNRWRPAPIRVACYPFLYAVTLLWSAS